MGRGRGRKRTSKRDRTSSATRVALARWWTRGSLVWATAAALVLALSRFLGAAEKVVAAGTWVWSATFRYPVKIEYVGQRATAAGYLLHVRIKSTNGATVFIPTDRFRVDIVRDEQVVGRMSAQDRKKLVYGERVRVFDDIHVVQAVVEGRSFANAATNIVCAPETNDLFFLLTVAGPGDPTLADRLRLGRAYRSLRVSIRKWVLAQEYLDARLGRILWIGADERTQIRER